MPINSNMNSSNNPMVTGSLMAGIFTLRPLTLDRYRDLFLIFSDPETMKYWSTSAHQQEEETKKMLLEFFDNKNVSSSMWGIFHNHQNPLQCQGWVSFFQFRDRICEVGYILNKTLWGKGHMTEILGIAIKDAFSRWNLHRIEAKTDPQNIASQRILEKIGFKKEGHLREDFLRDGIFLDTLIYGILERELE